MLGEYPKALEHYQVALALYEELGERGGITRVTGYIGVVYGDLGEYAKSLAYLRTALGLAEELGSSDQFAQVTGQLGWLYSQKEFEEYNPAVAEEYLLRGIEMMTDIGIKMPLHKAHQDLATFYKDQGRWQEAHQHLARAHELKEELHSIEARRKIEQIEHMKLIAEMEKRRAIEQAHEQAEREALGLRAQLLEVQLDRQRSELAAQAMHLAKQTEMLGEFRNDLRTIMREGGDPLVTVKQIKEKLKELPCEAIDWTKFDAEFRQTYPEFQSKLLQRYPELTGMELKVCALLKLKLTSVDIAKLLCLSERSVEGHRLHIRRKMELVQGEDVHTVLTGI
jgi:DNA-binding CsgD family transcriptional regulator